ncbi:hypothetical protein [Pelagibacterium lacus]|uniref:Cytochrome c n=1 Tax=Pelagibacterium lacus TaxID=2282655 RepID=A0A369WA06_9HYPH|nr:hypothetical protein [Pelagibacterium lacus]RDE10200.1 hypothetical protein DVH29_02050 [Pelagibacterium lacus]
MRPRILPLLALLAFTTGPAVYAFQGQAQTNEAETADLPAAEEEELDPADANAAPFPPGRHAALTKRVCTECHMANMVLQRTYTYDEAVRFYQIMVTSNTETDEARAVIEYLSTTLAP